MAVPTDPRFAKLSDYAAVIEQGQHILTALAGFITIGLGGVFLAVRKVLQHTKDVEDKVEPVRREIIERDNDTLSMRVDTIVTRIDSIDTERQRQHEDNTERLARIEDRMDRMQEDVTGIRKVMDKILTKLAGLS